MRRWKFCTLQAEACSLLFPARHCSLDRRHEALEVSHSASRGLQFLFPAHQCSLDSRHEAPEHLHSAGPKNSCVALPWLCKGTDRILHFLCSLHITDPMSAAGGDSHAEGLSMAWGGARPWQMMSAVLHARQGGGVNLLHSSGSSTILKAASVPAWSRNPAMALILAATAAP